MGNAFMASMDWIPLDSIGFLLDGLVERCTMDLWILWMIEVSSELKKSAEEKRHVLVMEHW